MIDLYRSNVGIVVVNHNGLVLMCARADQQELQWQFPQGGIEKGEDIILAAKRELYEETGITKVKLKKIMPELLRYKFPTEDKRHRFGKYVGQEQQWVLFDFYGNDSEINFAVNPNEIEFKAYEWVDLSEAPKRIVAFKKPVYQKMIEYFTPFVKK